MASSQAILHRSIQYVQGLCDPNEALLKAWHVKSKNEWNQQQNRVLVLTTRNFARVKFDKKHNKISHYFKMPFEDVIDISEEANGMKIMSRLKDGNMNVKQFAKYVLF